jgi:hypothetical protein
LDERQEHDMTQARSAPEDIRNKAGNWLSKEVTPWRARFETRVTRPPEFPRLD